MFPKMITRTVLLAFPFGFGLHVTALSCDIVGIASLLPTNGSATVTDVTKVPDGGNYGNGAADLEYPYNATNLPSLCAVQVNIATPGNTSYNFGLFLPDDYNHRMMTAGNGGLGGGISWGDMANSAHYGFAALSTDTGHDANLIDGTWGYSEPEKLYNWGYRAMHGSVALAKDIVTGYYCSSIAFSYYSSCSTGGRQGLKEIADHPDSFDGIVIGAAAWDIIHLAAGTLKTGLYNYPTNSSGYIPYTLYSFIVEEFIAQCDSQDGLVDGIISDPFGCNFTFKDLLCQVNSTSTSCLTADQVATVEKVYHAFVDNGTLIFPGLAYGADPSTLIYEPLALGVDYFTGWVLNDTTWNIEDLDFADIELAEKINPGSAEFDNFDLSPFRARGGKIIQYHGLADGLIQTGTSLVFYQRLYEALNAGVPGDLDDFYRLFFIPGMEHCYSSEVGAPWYIASGFQITAIEGANYSVPGYQDADHDVVLAILKWVEEGEAPDQIIATKFYNDTVSDGVEIQRPLCVYPKQAKYISTGSTSEPENWICA